MASVRIALIKPGLGALGNRRYRSKACMEPLALAVLAGLPPAPAAISVFDDRYEDLPLDQHYDLVGITVTTFTAQRSYEIADAYRSRGMPVIMGGIHPTLLPGEALEHADAVVVGEAEGIWPKVLEDLQKGALQQIYRNISPPDLSGLTPDRSIFKKKRYAPIGLVQFSRGCRFNCDFCSVRAVTSGRVRYRPVGDVIAEIEASRRRFILFVDDNITADPSRAKELFQALIPLRIRWGTQISMDFVDDPELLPLMVKSGCVCLQIGLESLNTKTLRQMRKGWSRAEDYAEKLAIIRRHGIPVYGMFVFGYDEDRAEDIDRTADFAMEQKLFLANFNDLHPYPGTALYQRLQDEDRFTHPKWWIDPTYRFGEAPFYPRGMSPKALGEGCFRARKKFHNIRSILHRSFEFNANAKNPLRLILYLMTNLASRQDIFRKQGMRLGMRNTKESRDLPAKGPIRILLVLPDGKIHRLKLGPLTMSFREAPLTLTTLAGLIPLDMNARVRIVDESVGTRVPYEETFDLVGISCLTGTAPRAYEIADTFMKRNTTVVLGGFHVTLLPEEARKHAHCVVLGFAEETWPQLLRDFEKGELKPVYKADGGRIDNLPIPRRELQKRLGYMAPNTIFATRGCKGKCDFCAIPAANVNWQTRPIGDVIDEMRHIKSERVVFNDVSIAEDPEYAKQLFQAMIPLKKKWGGLATTRIVQDREVLDLMHKSGCVYLLIGFESFENRSLSSINKGFNKAELYRSVVGELHDRGIIIQGCFIFGFDEDDASVFEATVHWVNELKIDIPRYAIYTPYPCTNAFERLKAAKRILHENWAYYDTQHVVFQPRNMTARQLDDGFKWAYRKTFELNSILKRTLTSKKNFPITFLGNLAYKLYVRRIHSETERVPMDVPVNGAQKVGNELLAATYGNAMQLVRNDVLDQKRGQA